MTQYKTKRPKILTIAFGLTICLALMLGIILSGTQVAHAETTTIDTLGVAFKKVNVGDTLDAAFDFENETNKTLKVPAGANYTATLVSVSKNGQGIKLWDKDDASLPWSRVETQSVEQNVAYCIRVRFKTNDGYKLVRDAARLRSNMQVLGAELGKGKDIEIWDSAGMNSIATIVNMDFLITKGMTYVGNIQSIYPEIGKSKTGTIGIEGVDTGFFISGAPAPYTYEAKIAPIGMEIQTSNVFDKSNCYYQITAVNAMDGGTMYITATAADGKTCNIPVQIGAVSGGHEHTWSDFGKIDFEHHGYTKCTDPACPGVAPAFDKGSQYAVHEFVGGCTEKCTKCGNLDNPNAKHNLKFVAETPATCSTTGMNAHYTCEGCGKYFDEDKNETTKAALTIPATGVHNYGAWVSNGDGTHTRTCTTGSHSETENCSGGTATCENKAVCEVCGEEYGDIPGHNYGEVTYTWTSDNKCKAERVCTHDNTHVESETVTATAEEIKAATCKEKGKMKYTATFVNTAFAAQVKEVDIDFTEHTYGDLIPEVSATADKTGTKKHFECSVCGKLFDENKNEVTAADLVIPKIGTHNVVINGESKIYKEGESVTVTAEDKKGKEFVGWQDETGKIVSEEKSYTFEVKRETVLTAVYKDKTANVTENASSDGLSGGQIAGIVIGSVLIAGIGGFAIFWFAVKKKTFADLIAAIKGLGKKKQ